MAQEINKDDLTFLSTLQKHMADTDRLLRNHVNTLTDIKTIRIELGQNTQNFFNQLDALRKDVEAIKEKIGLNNGDGSKPEETDS